MFISFESMCGKNTIWAGKYGPELKKTVVSGKEEVGNKNSGNAADDIGNQAANNGVP